MDLTLFFRLILTVVFQKQITHDKKCTYRNEPMNYDNQLFYCPTIVCKDGWSISLQIHNGNYCKSENGYRTLGHTMESVEFGFPSADDKDLHLYSEMYGNSSYNNDTDEEILFDPSTFSAMGGVGRIPVSVIQAICDNNHGGIDWEATISAEKWDLFINGKKTN